MRSINLLKQGIVSLALVMLLFGSFTPLLARADNPGQGPYYASGQTGIASGQTVPNGTSIPGTTPSQGDIGCNFSLNPRLDICLSNIVYYISVGLGSSLAYLGAYVFDISVQLSLNSLAYSIDFIASSWTVVRDIANMAFLFILIYIALVIMLSAETSGTMSMLAGVIIVALLVNFSFFFTRVGIDTGNILAVQFYNAIPGAPLNTNASPASTAINATLGGSTGVKDLSAGIMNAIGIQSLLDGNSFQNLAKDPSSFSQWMANLIGLSFLYLCLGAVFWILFIMFLATGIKFLVRMVVLWFLIIASPLALVARAIPNNKVSGYYDKWQAALITHALYPAFFLFIFLVLYKITAAIGGTGGLIGNLSNSLAGASGSIGGTNSSFIGTMAVSLGNIGIKMGIIVAIMYLGFKASQQIAVMGAQMADKITGKIGGGILGGVANVTGRTGRGTLGWAGNKATKSASLNAAANEKGIGGWASRGLLNFSKRAGSATYDPRNARVGGPVKKGLEGLVGGIAVPTGKAATKGYTEEKKETKDKDEKDRQDRAAIVRDAANKAAVKRIEEQTAAGQPHDQKDIDRIQNLNKREMGSLKAAEIEKIAHVMSSSQLKHVEDSEKYNDEEKEKIRHLYNEKNKEAPLAKANDIISKLNDIDSHLSSGAKIGRITSGTLIDEASTTAAALHITNKISETIARRDAIAPSDKAGRTIENRNLEELRRAAKEVENLNKEREKVPAHAGGVADAGKFKAL
jgi:hypothetical protein